MTMRPRTPTFRAQPSVRRVYETLQPKSEMKENPESYLLHVYLPGYTKERVKISYVASSRMVRISGERPIQGNRWIRFDQTYPVPENCEAEKLQGRFELGTLILTIPKKSISQVSPKQEVKTTQENTPPVPSEKAVPEAKPEKAQETIPPQYTTTKVGEPIGDKASLPSSVKGPDDLKAQRGTKEDTSSERPIESLKPEDDKGLRALIPQKGQEETVKRPIVTGKPEKGEEELEPKPRITLTTKIQTDEKPQKGHEEEVEPKPTLTTITREEEIRLKTFKAAVKKKLEEKTMAEDAEKEKISKKEVKEGEKPNDMEKAIFKEKEMRTSEVSPKESAEPSGPKVPEKSKEDMIDTVGSIGIKELAASASQVVTIIAEGKWNEEEKHLVVNMGAAVLVIAALGAYVSYRFASSG